MRRIREWFGYRPMRHGVKFGGRFEKLDFTTREAAEEWARAYTFDPNYVVFDYTPVELAIDRSKVRRDEHVTPDGGA